MAKCVGVEDEWGPVLLVLTGADKDRGMSVSLSTGMRKDNICYKQSVWELTKSVSGLAGVHGSRDVHRYVAVFRLH